MEDFDTLFERIRGLQPDNLKLVAEYVEELAAPQALDWGERRVDIEAARRIAEELQSKRGHWYWSQGRSPVRPIDAVTGWVLASRLSGGRHACVYCGADLLRSARVLYGGGKATDHLLPKNKYAKLVSDPCNLVPACQTCNQLKGQHNPNGDGASLYDPATESQLKWESRLELIRKVRQYLTNKVERLRPRFERDRANWEAAQCAGRDAGDSAA